MVNNTKNIEVIDTVKPTDRCTLSEAALDVVVGGRMKLPGPNVNSVPYGEGGGQPFGEWAMHPNYLQF
jgi:hypothetical protein